MKTIILANAPVNNGNRGCVALSITTMMIIDKIFCEAGEEYRLYLTDSGIAEKKDYYYEAKGLKKIFFTPCSHYPFRAKTLAYNILKTKRCGTKPFKEADFILDIGQGDSFADIYGKQRFERIDDIHRAAIQLNKPYCILPQTIGPFKNDKIRKQAVKSIEKANLVMTRDRQSLDYVHEIAPKQNNVREYIDVAFFMPYKKIDFSKDNVHVGLNISALLWHGGYTHDNQFGLEGDYQRIIRSIIDYFLSIPNVTIHLIAHVVVAERHVENDYAVNYDLWMEFDRNPRLILAPFALSPTDVKGYIAGMDFFMGARMHATIGAFSSGVPVVPMAYSRKFNGLFVDTLQYSYLADLKVSSETEVIETVKAAYAKRSDLKSIIEDRMNGVVCERGEMMTKDLKKFFGLL